MVPQHPTLVEDTQANAECGVRNAECGVNGMADQGDYWEGEPNDPLRRCLLLDSLPSCLPHHAYPSKRLFPHTWHIIAISHP